MVWALVALAPSADAEDGGLARAGFAPIEGPVLSIRPGASALVARPVPCPASDTPWVARAEPLALPRGVALPSRAELQVEACRVVFEVRTSAALVDGPARLKLRVFDRKTKVERVAKEVTVQVELNTSGWTERELLEGFWGYRAYRAEAIRAIKLLRPRGVRLNLAKDGPIPPLIGARASTLAQVAAFEATRRRMYVARTRMTVAARSGDARARAWIPQMQAAVPRGVPALAERPAPPPTAPEPHPSAPPEARDVPPDASDVLAPIASYEPGTDAGSVPDTSAPLPRPPPSDEPDPADLPATVEIEDEVPAPAPPAAPRPEDARGLVLDGTFVGFATGTRLTYASVTRDESAEAAALFIFAELALSPDLGVELDVPVQFVRLDELEAESVVASGNPRFSVKYRFDLPELFGGNAALAVAGRYALPLSPPAQLAPTDKNADAFSREVNFVDPWAFFVDRHNLGLGASVAWRRGLIHGAAQVGLDYFFPIGDRTFGDFVGLSYGAGIGIVPIEELGGFLELRATTLTSGGGRTEAVGYAGARGMLFGFLEPALFVGVPIGSITSHSSVQLGAELRVSWALRRERVKNIGEVDTWDEG